MIPIFNGNTFTLIQTAALHEFIATTGRPRPDFFNRCYGADYLSYKNTLKPCITGKDDFKIMDGRRSFPSGHSASNSNCHCIAFLSNLTPAYILVMIHSYYTNLTVSFCIMGFISLYIHKLLKPYSSPDLHKSWKYLFVIFPLLIASLVAISRTCEYKHHYEGQIYDYDTNMTPSSLL